MFRLSELVVVVLLATLAQLVLAEECDDLSIGRTLQDPEDCHGYFLCHGGQKLQQYCSTGMKYDKDLGECIVGKCPPCNCIADPGSGSSTVTPADTGTPPEPSTATPTNTPPDTETDTPTGTPPEPSASTIPTETATPTNTPPDTETDTPTGTPSEPSASTIPTETATPTNTPPDTETDTPTGTTTDIASPDPPGCTSTPVTSTSTIDPLVNCDNIPNGSFFAHAEHCRNYWVCREGIPVLLYCEIGSWFDEVNDVCDFRHLVDCPANID